jgi:hypothetical protein
MATLFSEIQFIGSLGELSAYKMRGSDKVILRTKGGPTRKQVKTARSFVNVRRINAEFGGRSTTSRWIILMMGPQKTLADTSMSGRLNALLKPIQELDKLGGWGQRHVQLSKNPQLLAGFSLKDDCSFDAVIRTPLLFSLSRENRTARVEIPALLPRINFFPSNQPFYSVQVVLGIVPDLFFKEGKYAPTSRVYPNPVLAETPWCPLTDRSEAALLEIALRGMPPDENFSMLLSVGIKYGNAKNGSIQQVKHAGCAKVLALV